MLSILLAPHGGIKIGHDDLDLVVEADADIRAMLRALARARSVREVFIINGQEPGNLSRAL